jgi:hypothetical protein
MLCLGQQHAIGHQLDQSLRGRLILEPDLVPDPTTDLSPQFIGQSRRDAPGRNPTGLRVADHAPATVACFQAHLGQLGAFAAAGFPADNQCPMLAQRRNDPLTMRRDRQI